MNKVVRIAAAAALVVCMALACGCTRDPNVRKQKYMESGQRYASQGKYGEAAIQFANAVKIDPTFAEAHYALAQAFIKLHDGNGAYAELLRFIDLQPDNMKAQIDLANVLFAAREYKQTVERADLVLKREPKNADALMVKGMALSRLGDQTGALAAMKQAVILTPEKANFFSNLGAVQVAIKDLAGAEQSFRKAVELDPKSTDAVLNLARFYELQHRTGEAEAQFQKAVQIAPESADNRHELAKFYFRQARMTDAEKIASQAKNDLPKDPQAYGMLGDFYRDSGQIDKATAEYAAVFAAHKDDLRARKNYIQLLILRNRADEAEELNQEILKKNSKDTEALTYKAQILLRRGQASDAIPIFESVLKTEPDNAVAHDYLGQALAAAGNSERAAAEWSKAIELRPALTDANRRLADLALSKNDAAGLRRAGEALIRNQPKSATGYVYVAMADILQRQSKAADTNFAKALEVEPNSPVVTTKLAFWRLKQSKFSEAEQLFERALAVDPNNTDGLSGLVSLYTIQKQPAKAVARVQAQLAKSPGNGPFHRLMARLLIGQQNLPGAQAELNKAIELRDPDPSSILMLAQVEAALGKIEEARRGYRRFSELAPTDPRGYFYQAVFEGMHSNFAQAEELYRKTLAIDPDNPAANNNLADLLLRRGGNTDLALSLAQTARQRAPGAPDIADTLAWAYYHKGVYGSARKLLEEAINRNPNNPTFHFHLGRCYASMNDKSKARVELQRALQLNPKFPDAEEARKTLAELN